MSTSDPDDGNGSTGRPTTGSPAPNRGRAGRPARPGRSSPPSTTGPHAIRRPSRLAQLAGRLRSRPGGQVGRIPAPAAPRAPRPGRVPAAGGPLLGDLRYLLGKLWRCGQGRACGLTPEDWRVIGILAVAVLVAVGGQVDLDVSGPPPATAPTSAVTAAQVLRLASGQIGTTEARDGSTPYHRDYAIAADQPWCAVFVWDMFREAGAPGLIGPKTAYTPTLATYFRVHGQWSSTPTVGALVFYDWPDRLGRIQHVGIVESIGPNSITTIEANTSSGVAGSQDNGGGVWRRIRPRNRSIVGYGLPAYSLTAKT